MDTTQSFDKKTAIEAFKKLDEIFKSERNDNTLVNKECNSNSMPPTN